MFFRLKLVSVTPSIGFRNQFSKNSSTKSIKFYISLIVNVLVYA